MKKILKSLTLVACLLSAFVFGAHAQTQAGHVKQQFKSILTADQQAMLKQNKQKRREAAKAFKSTLTTEQNAILADRSVSRKERKAKLEATLTTTQKEVLIANKVQNKANRKVFVATLSDAQRAQMKEIVKGRHHRGELKNNKPSKA